MPVGQKFMAALRRKAEPRFFTIMHTLLYPGVLGSLMYAVPDNIASGRVKFDLAQFLLAIALFAMFVMDYAHSVTEENKATYSIGTFVADLFIVVLLFVAGQRILGTNVPPDIHPAWWLACVKLAAVVWEYLENNPDQSDEKRVEKETDFAFVLLYVAVGGVAQIDEQVASYCLTAVLFLDAFFYIVYRKLSRARAASA